MPQDSALNRAHWDRRATNTNRRTANNSRGTRLAWGVWSIPKTTCGFSATSGKDVIELGCGGAQWSIGLTQRGANCVGLDNSERQLEHAQKISARQASSFRSFTARPRTFRFPMVRSTSSFAITARCRLSTRCAPFPKRLDSCVRAASWRFPPRRRMHFICWDESTDSVGTTLKANYFEERRADDGSSVCFSLPYGEWISLFRRNGFFIESLVELRPPQGATTTYASSSATIGHMRGRPSKSGAFDARSETPAVTRYRPVNPTEAGARSSGRRGRSVSA